MSELSDYEWLVGVEARPWLAECADVAEPSHRLQQRLRKTLSAARARLIAEQVELRRKAVDKFGDLAHQMFFTDRGLQQCTDRWIAAYKAERFVSKHPLTDYCCGIGGDLVALASRTATTGWDYSPEIATLATANLHAWGHNDSSHVRVGPVEEHPPSNDSRWHLDPDRRAAGKRSTHIEWHSPSADTINAWVQRAPHGAIKLAPATVLDPALESQAELEWISRNRQCRQLVAWFGQLAAQPATRRATVVSGGASHSFVGDPATPCEVSEHVGQFVYDTDPAVRAAKLTAALAAAHDCAALAPGESYLTADVWVEQPLLSGFRVIETWPLRLAELVKHLNTCHIGVLEIKTRGVATRPEQIRRKLKLSGTRALTLLVTRQGKREIAILAERTTAG